MPDLFARIASQRPRLYGVLVALLFIAAQFIDHDLGFALAFLPAAALFLALLLGRRPGERLLTRLREGRRTPRRPAASVPAAPPTERRRISGGTLLARRLAGRAPPHSLHGTA